MRFDTDHVRDADCNQEAAVSARVLASASSELNICPRSPKKNIEIHLTMEKPRTFEKPLKPHSPPPHKGAGELAL
jgi:hypothetical protein